MASKTEWKSKIGLNLNVRIFPEVPETTREYIAGYFFADERNENACKQAKLDRNKLVKSMRSDGWTTYTEPGYRNLGRNEMDYDMNYPFSASREKHN